MTTNKKVVNGGSIVAGLVLALALAACGGDRAEPESGVDHAEEGEAAHDEGVKGPHGGRLLQDGDFAVELTIFERGVPPEFRAYAYRKNKPVKPAEVNLSVELARLGGRVDRFTFAPQEDYLRGSATVEEPHSFDVKVQATENGAQHAWTYASYEGRVTIDPEMAKASGIEVAPASPGALREVIKLYGSVQPNAERLRNVTARFPGVIKSVSAKIGDRVRAGESLATIESNESLQTYAISAPINGVVTQRMVNPGEQAGDQPLFVVADFSTVWAELSVFPRDHARLRPGMSVQVSAADGQPSSGGRIGYVSPVSATGQSLVARVVLDNAKGQWTPGVFVNGAVTVGETPVPLLIPRAAVQTYRDWQVAFLNVGNAYEVRPLELGRGDGESIEVLAGLAAADRIVVAGSYIIKADIEKSGASHDH